METSISVYIDGSCDPNPGGIMGIGIYSPKLFEISKNLGKKGTNNQAEFEALLCAIDELQKRGIMKAIIYTDSQLVHGQVVLGWEARSETSKKYTPTCQRKLEKLKYQIDWIPRRSNRAANALAVRASHRVS